MMELYERKALAQRSEEICKGDFISVTDILERNFQFIQNGSTKENDRAFSLSWLGSNHVSIRRSISFRIQNNSRRSSSLFIIFRLQEHFPNCCLPQALGGDVPETNAHDFYEFCKENAQVVEKKYQYLKFWSKKEQTL